MVRRPNGNVIIASDGLSDPFDDISLGELTCWLLVRLGTESHTLHALAYACQLVCQKRQVACRAVRMMFVFE